MENWYVDPSIACKIVALIPRCYIALHMLNASCYGVLHLGHWDNTYSYYLNHLCTHVGMVRHLDWASNQLRRCNRHPSQQFECHRRSVGSVVVETSWLLMTVQRAWMHAGRVMVSSQLCQLCA